MARLCDDPAIFCIAMPTRNRPDFVARALGFLAEQDFRGRLILVDASDDERFAATAKAAAGVSTFTVVHNRPKWPGNAWREIADALVDEKARYVQLHHDDDFYFLDEIDAAISSLENDPSFATAEGRFLFVERAGTGFSLATHDRFAYLEEEPVARVRDCFARFGHLLYAVMRRDLFVAALDHVQSCLDQGWFDQYAISALLAAHGKAAVTDRLYGVRQLHESQHHRQFKDETAQKHWPGILQAPDFEATYAAFKRCLMDKITGLASEDIDEGLLTLARRASGHLPEREAGDVALFERANQKGREEHERIARVIAAIRRSG